MANGSETPVQRSIWFWPSIILAVGAVVVAFLLLVPPDKRIRIPIGTNHSQDFFYALSALSFVAIISVVWFFGRQQATASLERTRSIATFAIVLIGLMILWGVFFQAIVYITKDPTVAIALIAAEREILSPQEEVDEINRLRNMAIDERNQRIADVTMLAGIIIAPLGTLIGFVAGQAAGSSGLESARASGARAAENAQDIIDAQRELLHRAGLLSGSGLHSQPENRDSTETLLNSTPTNPDSGNPPSKGRWRGRGT